MYITMPNKEHIGAFRGLVSEEAWERLQAPGALLMGGVEDNRAVAALVAELDELTAELLWIYAVPEYRGRGYAAALLRAFLSALEKTGERTEVLAFFPDTPVQEDLFRLLFSCDFQLEYPFETDIYDIRVGDLTGSELAQRRELSRGAVALSEVPEVYLRLFNNSRRGQAAPVDFPIRPEDYLHSSAAFVKDRSLRGLMLLEEEGSDLSLVWCWTAPGENAAVPAMLHKMAAALEGKHPPETRIWLKTGGEVSRVIARVISGQVKGTGILLARRTLLNKKYNKGE